MNAASLSPESQIRQLASELRGLSNMGLVYTEDPYQAERYHRIIAIAGELTSLVDERDVGTLQRHFAQDLHYRTPYAVVDCATFDPAGRILLIQRADNRLWALPGGACEINESPATNALREAWEETGCVVRIDGFLGLFDNRLHGGQSIHHLYCLLFGATWVAGDPIVTRECVDVGWFEPTQIPWDGLTPGHPDRIRHALAWRANPSQPPFYDEEAWHPEPTWQHGEGEA
jgi:ADP-ribose pyrophosphatase YjhB (NUDIX family)